MEFSGYYGKHKDRKKVCTQAPVTTKTELLKIRVSPALKQKIAMRSQEVNKSASELTRILWHKYFEKYDQVSQKEDVEDFLKRVK